MPSLPSLPFAIKSRPPAQDAFKPNISRPSAKPTWHREWKRKPNPYSTRALAVRETGLRNLQQESEKLAWSRGRTEVYRDLLQVDLKLKTPSEALAAWEWYKGASLRSTKTVEATAAALPGNATLISYALLKGSIIAFVLRDGKVQVHTLSLPRDLDPNVSHFLNLCSDPSSDISQLNTAGRQLYRILVAPVETDVRGATALTIETDGVIDQVPFNLLQASDGHYLGDKFEITFSQGMSYLPTSRTSLAGLSPNSAALVVVASGAADSSLPVLPGADQEGAEVASLFHNAVLIHGHEVTRAEVLAQLHDARAASLRRPRRCRLQPRRLGPWPRLPVEFARHCGPWPAQSETGRSLRL